MSDKTGIQWTDHTHNPWWGCARVSPACRFCYAASDAKRYGFDVWRRHGPRRMLSDANWAKPLKWNRDAERAGVPARVFCASMADVFEDHPDVIESRKRLWDLIEATPWLHWQLLTKRPENVMAMVPWGDSWPSWVWLGVSVETQRYAEERIPLLLSFPAAIRFLSCEPLLGPLDLRGWLSDPPWIDGDLWPPSNIRERSFDWVIAGGESGARARPTELGWLDDLVEQCRAASVPVFVKQFGKVLGQQFGAGTKGGDMDRWPPYLRVRQFPRAPIGAACPG